MLHLLDIKVNLLGVLMVRDFDIINHWTDYYSILYSIKLQGKLDELPAHIP